MNVVTVWGNNQSKCDLIEEVAYFCIECLMPRIKTLDICIDTDIGDENADGFCLAQNKREFELLIDEKLEGDDLITAVAHEMTHVSQYAKGRLEIDGKDRYETLDQYLNLWYEKEAFEMQEILLKKYKTCVKM